MMDDMVLKSFYSKSKMFLSAATIITILIFLPFIYPNLYILSFLITIFISTILAESFNIFSGYSGLVCLGYAAFYGIGAYASAILINSGISPFISFIISGVAGVALAAFIGSITLRLRSIYFVMVTFSFGEILREIFRNWKAVGGALGITLPPTYTYVAVYFVTLLTMLTCVVVTYKLEKSKIGLYLVAIRENEEAAEALGINVFKYRIIAFCLSCFFPSVTGGLYAWWMTYIDPPTVFSILVSLNAIIMTTFGGKGTWLGPILGALILGTIGEILWANFPYAYLSIYAVALILIILFLPEGLIKPLQAIISSASTDKK